MKRIDDKIKEIEKKDKTNRWMFYGIIVLIIGFLFYASTTQKKLDSLTQEVLTKNEQLKSQIDEIEAQKIELEETITRLEKSQTPIAFWNQTAESKNASTYIDYILHKGKPETTDEYRGIALENIKLNETAGKTVWLYCGKKDSDRIVSSRIMEIIYRKDDTPSGDAMPLAGDIVKNNTMNRNTYRNFTNGNVAGQNNADKTWKKGSKAQVLDVKTAGPAVYIQIKF